MENMAIARDMRSEAENDDAPVSRAERRDQQVQRILDAAKICFVRSGFQGASMQQICAEAGMSPGALYRYFASKEAIIEAITAADRKQDAEIFAVILEAGSVIDAVVAAGMAHIKHIHEDGAAPLFTEIRAESMRNEAIMRCCMDNMGQVQAMFAEVLGPALARGEIDPILPLEALMPTIMAIGEGLAINDLPSKGVSLDHLETFIRSIAVATLRPASR